MKNEDNAGVDRRDFLKLVGVGGAVFASGLYGCGGRAVQTPVEDFYFVQLTDTHWGFDGARANPDAAGTLPKAIAAVNALATRPEFVIFTGDLTHTTDDSAQRRARMQAFKTLAAELTVKRVYFIPGEHDAALDRGEAYRELFGALYYSFDHGGIHFVALDNGSDPRANLGETQLEWLAADLAQVARDTAIVVFAHRPMFDLYPEWDWTTRDARAALALLAPFARVNVFYGHIHQQHRHRTGHIEHRAAESLIFPLPAPGSVPQRGPVAWDPTRPYRGLGWRRVAAGARRSVPAVDDFPLRPA